MGFLDKAKGLLTQNDNTVGVHEEARKTAGPDDSGDQQS